MSTGVPLTRLAAYFGAIGGGAPDYGDPPSDEWSVDRIDESDPAHPKAILTRALQAHAINRTALFETREVHIWACDITKATNDPDYRVTPLFWGVVTANTLHIREQETETAVAHVRRYHYGVPLEGEQVYDPDAEDTFFVHRDARFNPEIDSKVIGNMAKRVVQTGYPTDYNLWIDPESIRTEEAADVHKLWNDPDIEADQWSLGLAVETLQRVLNGDETFLSVETVFADPEVPEAPFDNAEEPQNIRLKRGLYLDECLQQLLPQYGCGFFIRVDEDDTPGHADRFAKPVLSYYQRGQGTEKDLKLQAPDSTLDASLSEVLLADITFDIAKVVNRVHCLGHRVEREVTIELFRGWPEDDDSLDAEDVTRGEENSKFEEKPNVHRLWIANEAGDWTDSRTEITAELDLADVFNDGAGNNTYVPKRRRLYSPLTYRNQAPTETDGLRAPIKVEWTTASEPTEPEDWEDVTGGKVAARFTVLEDQLGIYFNEDEPPQVLIDAGSSARVRVTGTIVGDQCLESIADVPAWAANQDEVTLLIDVGDRYFDRARQDTGDLASVLSGNHDARDDAADLDTFATALRDQELAATVDARITLSGIVTDYEIGDLLTGISGRNISFNRTSDEAGHPLYVQVVGRVFEGNKQTTQLIVKPYDAPASGGGR